MEIKKFDTDKKLRKKPAADMGSIIYGKIPPQAKDMEEAVLGAIMLERNAYDTVHDVLTPEAFYVEANQKIFRAAVSLKTKNQPIDLMTIVEELKFMGELDFCGGPYAVTKLTNAVVSGANVEAHARIVLQKFIGRELIRISAEIIAKAYDDTEDIFDLLDQAEADMSGLHGNTIRKEFKQLRDIMRKNVERLEELRLADEHVTGVPTGFEDLDKVTSGWQPTDLVILAARTSVGKTAFALTLARNAAKSPKKCAVGLFSLEMSDRQLVNRVLSAESTVWMWKLRTGRLSDEDMSNIYKTEEDMHESPIFIDDTPSITTQEFRAKARMMKRKHNVGIIIIDYLQLMKKAGHKGTREQEVASISSDIKATAKELEIPIIALAQLSRGYDAQKAGGSEPQLRDLRESGAIEQDADAVMLMWRPTDEQIAEDPTLKNIFNMKLAKHRNGSLERFIGKFTGEDQKHHYLTLVDGDTLSPLKENWSPVTKTNFVFPVRDPSTSQKEQNNFSGDNTDELPF